MNLEATKIVSYDVPRAQGARNAAQDQHDERAMPFPDSPRVIYKRNPLNEVICEVRFPPILRIGSEPPANFQERVRADYPLFSELPPVPLATNVPAEIASIARSMLPRQPGAFAYEFASEDRAWSITLARDALALKTTGYRRWETFRSHLEGPLEGLAELYRPAFFARVGLRYVDVIQRSKLGMNDRPWSDLLKPPMAGEFTAVEIRGHIEHAARELGVKLPDGGSVMIRHGIALDADSKEQCYVIDSDFFTENRVEPKNALELLDNFNRKSGRLFRWCIQDALHQAMEPTEVPD